MNIREKKKKFNFKEHMLYECMYYIYEMKVAEWKNI